jgi:hypothetical protein
MIYLLIGYMWLFVHRPFEVWPALAALRIERVYMLLTLAYWALAARKRWVSNPLHAAYAAFSTAVILCWLASPWSDQERAQVAVENYLKQLVFYVLLVTTIQDEAGLKKICTGFLGIVGVYMAHSLREYLAGRHVYRMGIARMVGVDESMGDPNSFGGSIIYALPFMPAVWMCLPGRTSRAALLGYFGLSVLCVILTGSRSSLIGLLAWIFVMVVRSRYRFRLLVPVVVLLAGTWLMLPPNLQNRFYTLIDPSVGPANAQESAEGRADGLRNGVKLLETYPLTGCGPGVWRFATGSPIESHNLYGQVVGEMGLLGILTFGPVVLLLWWNARWIKATYRRLPEWNRDFLYYVGGAVGLALLLLLFLGFGGHNLFRYSWLWYGGFVIIARQCIQQRLNDRQWNDPRPTIEPEGDESLGGPSWTPTPS